MPGEFREPKPKETKIEGEKVLFNELKFSKNFPLTYEIIKKGKNSLEEFTLDIKEIKKEKGVEEYLSRRSTLLFPPLPELYLSRLKEEVRRLPTTLYKWNKYAETSGFENGVLVDLSQIIGPLFPYDSFQMGLGHLFKYQQLESFAPLFAKESAGVFMASEEEFLRGRPLEIQVEFFTKNEELLRLKKDGKLKNEKEKLGELNKLVDLLTNSARRQYIEKLEEEGGNDIIRNVATLTNFSEMLILGIEKPSLFMEGEKAKKELSVGFPNLEEKIIKQIIIEGNQIRKDLERKHRYEKEGGVAYA